MLHSFEIEITCVITFKQILYNFESKYDTFKIPYMFQDTNYKNSEIKWGLEDK